MKIKKKLNAIVFTDIAGFTKISSKDETYALSLLDKQREILQPIVKKYNGNWLKEIGDGLLLSFTSSLEAVECSIEIQNKLSNESSINIRVGIHQGDIFIKDNDIFGDDVNIASRIESFSPIGGVCISDKVKKDISSNPEIKTQYIGYRKLKGVGQDTKIYCILSDNLVKFKKQWFPLIVGWMCIGWGSLASLGVIISFFLTDLMSTYDISYSTIPKTLSRHFIYILLGISNLMYVNGISGKTHRYLVYSSYIFILFIIISALLFTFE